MWRTITKKAIKTRTVKNICEFFAAVDFATELFDYAVLWWRGQADREWGLTTSLHRDSRGFDERNMTVRFRLRARTCHTNVPKDTPALVQRHGRGPENSGH